MDSINKTLLLSLKQEVKTLNEVLKDLPNVNDSNEEIRSWLFPSKPHYFVNELINSEKIFRVENFKTYLELIIDRLYVGIRLLLNYVEERTPRINKENRFIHRPKLITLGFTFQKLWQAVSTLLCQNMSTSFNKETTTGGDKVSGKVFNKEIQTNIISLNKCDSCSSAILCMKNLLQSFDKYDLQKSRKDRNLILKPKIFDITQFGCMLQITNAIEKSVNSLYEKLFTKEQERLMLLNENQLLKDDIMKKQAKITCLEKETQLLKNKCEKDDLKMTILTNRYDELIQTKITQEHKIKTLEELVGNLNKSVKAHNDKVVRLVNEKENLCFLYKRLARKQLTVMRSGTSLQDRMSIIEGENLLMQSSFKQLEDITDNMNKKLNTITNVVTEVESKMNQISKQDKTIVSHLMEKLEKFKETSSRHSLQEEQAVKPSSFKIKGNPTEDLSRQIEENNAAILKLENENLKLNTIITKLNCLKNK